ncbi:hypothetical protein ACFL01_02085 [Planctomycetota bacterium]
MRAISLLSGGLDSLLSTRMILDQGIDVEAFNTITAFCTCTTKGSSCSAAESAVRQLGISLKVVNSTNEILELVKSPPHGYGSNINPCIDCRILLFRKAGAYMRETGASFIVTGEVLGERPMSQRRQAMELIERESGLDGLVVRPLSAALLEPSIPEQKGWVDRSRLMDIRGRSRKPQIEMARTFGFGDYPCPAGGCLLTDSGFARRMRDLIAHSPETPLNDVHLLKVGRHFRLSPEVKVIVGRDEKENNRLLQLARDDDTLLELADILGPLTVVRGPATPEQIEIAAAMTVRYSKARSQDEAAVAVRDKAASSKTILRISPAGDELLDRCRIGVGQ